MKTKRLSLALLSILGLCAPAAAFELTDSLTENLEPIVTVERDDSGVTVDYAFPGAYQHEDDLYPGTFNFAIPGFGSNGEPGEAAWLIHWDTFEIPYGCEASVQTLASETSVLSLRLAPARQDLPNSSDEGYSLENVPPVRDYTGWLPQNCVEKGVVKVFRDRNILYVGVYPISYNMQDGLIKAVDHLTYRVSFSPGIMTLSEGSDSRSQHDVDSDYMGTVFTSVSSGIDSSTEKDNLEGGEPELSIQAIVSPINWHIGDSYLILSRSVYASAVNKFVAWKKSMGYNVKVVMSDTWTPETIKSTVQSNYDSDSRLKYLLLFGDEVDLPAEDHEAGFEGYNTDYFYACMDGAGDDLPDLFCGRLSVSTLEEGTIVVNKIIDYDNLLTKGKERALLCSEFSDSRGTGYEERRFTHTCEDIANGLISEGKKITRVYYHKKKNGSTINPTYWASGRFGYGEEIPAFLKDTTFNWNGNSVDIIDAINSGVGYVIQRGHGSAQSWSRPYFVNKDVAALNNGKNTPIIFNISCKTGMFHCHSESDGIPISPPITTSEVRHTCLAEAFLRKNNGGGVAVIAACQNSKTQSNDVFIMEMCQLIWPTSQFCGNFPDYIATPHNSQTVPIRKLGEILNASKVKTSQNYPSKETEHNNQVYHLFGDPSMEIREPALPVSPNATITVNASSLQYRYKVIIDKNFKLVRVPNIGSEKVVWAQQPGSEYLLSEFDVLNYSYYIIGDNIAPTPLSNFVTSVQTEDSMQIDGVSDNGGMLNVRYTLPEDCNTGAVSVRGLTDNYTKSVECSPFENEVSIDMQGESKGVYIIELLNEGTIVDTQKIILK